MRVAGWQAAGQRETVFTKPFEYWSVSTILEALSFSVSNHPNGA
jgi:hypothetical protein